MRMSRIISGVCMPVAVVVFSAAGFAGNEASLQKEEVTQLKNQVAELQGKIAVLEQKISGSGAPAAAAVTSAPTGGVQSVGLQDTAENDPFA